jgi:DNA-binding beta-propeller fold protein YncE
MRSAFIAAGILAMAGFGAEADAAASSAMAVVATIRGPDGGWDYAAVDSESRRLFVAHGKAVMAVDLDTGKVEPDLVSGKRFRAVLPLPGGKALSTDGDNTATLFDAASGKVIASIATGVDPGAAIFDRASGLALVMDGRDGDVTLIDPVSATSPGRIRVGGRLIDGTTDGDGHAFVTVADRAEIVMVDIAGRKVMARYPLAGCERPSGVALDPASGNLVAACANRKAIALTAKDGAVTAELTIGERPDAAIFDARRKLFFIPCGEGSIAVISDGAAPAVTATVPTANGARTAALDAKTGRLYLPTADFQAPEPGKKRHTVIPGTFRILTVGES